MRPWGPAPPSLLRPAPRAGTRVGGSWAGGEVGLEEERGEGGRRREEEGRIREVLRVFDRSEGSRTGRGGPLGARAEPGRERTAEEPLDHRPRSPALPAPWPGAGRRAQGAAAPRSPVPKPATMLPPQLCWLPLLAALLPPAPAQKFSALTVSPARCRPPGPHAPRGAGGLRGAKAPGAASGCEGSGKVLWPMVRAGVCGAPRGPCPDWHGSAGTGRAGRGRRARSRTDRADRCHLPSRAARAPGGGIPARAPRRPRGPAVRTPSSEQ